MTGVTAPGSPVRRPPAGAAEPATAAPGGVGAPDLLVVLDGDASAAVLTSAVSQIGARALHFAINVVSTLAVTRYLGPDGYGDYILVLTVAAFVALVSDLGLVKLAVREIAADPTTEDDVVGSVVLVRLALGVVAVAVTVAVMAALGARPELVAAAAVVAVLNFTEAVLSVLVVFHVRVQQHYDALVRLAIEAGETALLLAAIARGAGLLGLVAAPVAGAAVGAGLAVVLARRRVGHVPPLARTTRVRPLLREAAPVGLTMLVAAAYLRVPVVLLGPLRSSAEAGLYAAAYQLVEYLLLASPVVINILLPLLARAHHDDAARFGLLYRRGTEALLCGTVPLAVVVVVAAPTIVTVAFGPGYADSATPLRLLGLALVPMILNFWLSVVLLAGGQQRITLAYDVVALAVTLALGVVLIPAAGTVGAAAVVLATSLVVVGCATTAAGVRLGVVPAPGRVAAIGGLGAGALGGAQALTVAGWPAPLAVAAGVLLFGAAVWRLGLLPPPSALAAGAPRTGPRAPGVTV